MTRLGDLVSPDLDDRRDTILAIPLGATEQHGPHLPLGTDTDLAVELCRRLAAARSDVLVAPPVPYGASGEHRDFAGTLSIGTPALADLIVELVRSATDTFDHVLLVSSHGGNSEAVRRAETILLAESRDVSVFHPRWDGDPHAGRPETAMMLVLSPERVRTERLAPGDTRPLADIWPTLRSGGVRAVTATGVLGDPTAATAEEGAALLDRISGELIESVALWRQPVGAGR
ncbi:MAG: mycofactocin biosynthesis peptidyl-dipeptidase MftE [Frankiaceae bacterium]|nr:mycofactocin biosynthesis peptidyl-dipeptidase MftE [Frankiaceae bacterium]MBV9869670.1 mycofactocin biosynthesis peptidyl-dipeptidase MftE [Frankiaceae bacterium]